MSTKLGLVARVVRQNTRRFTTSEVRQISEKQLEKIKMKQIKYQNKDDPAYLLSGSTYFYIVCTFALGSAIASGHTIYKILTHV